MSKNPQDGVERRFVENASGVGGAYANVNREGFVVGGRFEGVHMSQFNSHDPARQQGPKPQSPYPNGLTH